VGRPRSFITADEIPFVGGSLCLDLLNTTGARATGAPRERLRTYQDLLIWGRRAGIVDVTAEKLLRTAAAARKAEADRTLKRIRTLREELYQLFLGIAEGRRVDQTLVASLSRRWRAARSREQLVADKCGFELKLVTRADDLDGLLWPLVTSAVELLTTDRLLLIRRCAECDWLFLDESKNHSRRWCKSTCGNRARARERYHRIRQLRDQAV
jgi:predicted RNA-binding Zn ribbon-like protein